MKQIAEATRQDRRGGTLSKLFMLDKMANIFPLLIASWLRFGGDGPCIERVLKLLEAFIVRVYLLGGYRSDTAMADFHRKAHRVHGKELDYDGLLAKLSGAIDYRLNNDQFKRALGQDDLFERLYSSDMKFLLSEYEIHLRAKGDVPLAVATQQEILTAEYEVEHIWPQNPSYAMDVEEESEHQQNVHRLGNLTIASKSWNASMGEQDVPGETVAAWRAAKLLKLHFAGTEGAGQPSLLGHRSDQRPGSQDSGLRDAKVVRVALPLRAFAKPPCQQPNPLGGLTAPPRLDA